MVYGNKETLPLFLLRTVILGNSVRTGNRKVMGSTPVTQTRNFFPRLRVTVLNKSDLSPIT